MLVSYAGMYRQLRAYPLYLRYLAATFLSLVGDLATSVALLWFLATRAPDPALYLAIVSGVSGVAFPLMLIAAGYWVDSFGYVRVARCAVLARTAVWMLFVVLWVSHRLAAPMYPVLAIAIILVDAFLAPLLRPVDSALTQQTVAPPDRVPANALHGIQYEAGYILGPLLGGVMTASHVLWAAFALNLVSFLFLAGIFVTWPSVISRHIQPARSFPCATPLAIVVRVRRFVGALLDGARVLLHNRGLAGLVVLGWWWNLWILGPMEVIFPLLAHAYHGSAVSYGTFLVANSLGFLVGLAVWARHPGPRPWAWRYALVLAADGVLYVLVGLLHVLWIDWGLVGLGGFVTAPTDIWGNTLRQDLIPATHQGRVAAISGFLGFMGSPMGVGVTLLCLRGFHWPVTLCLAMFGLLLAAGAAVTAAAPAMRTA
jgi:hypothetical protein